MSICLVCLRSDRRIKLNKQVAEFHDELCGFTLFVTNTSYCSECEYLLKKFYKFKQKCEKATEVYQHWVKGVIKVPLHALHNLLPTSSLGVWLPNPKRIANIILEETVPQPGFEEIKSNSLYKTEEKLEYNSTNSNESNGDDLQNEIVMIETTPDYYIDDEKKIDLRAEEYLTEMSEQNDFECVEYLDLDIFNSDDIKNEEDPKDSNTNVVTCIKKRKDSLHVDVITKTHLDANEDVETCIEDAPKDSQKSRVTCIRKESKPSKRRKEISEKKEPISHKKRKITVNNKITSKMAVLEDDRLGEELILKLSSFGEIVTEDGTTVDRDLVTMFLRHDAGALVVRRLREATCREDVLDLSLNIETALTTIKNDRTNDKIDYKSMYDIEYLTTLEMKLEEMQKRKTYAYYVNAQHKCEICFQPFRGPVALDLHKKTYHDESVGGKFCPICKMRLTGNRHSRNRHPETHTVVYKCKLCPLVTYYSNTMKQHAEKHRGKKYLCKHCNNAYNCRSKYYDHMSKYHRSRVCVRCGRGFPSEKSLKIHKSKEHRDAPPIEVGKGVRCEKCDVTLISQSVYEAHIRDMHYVNQSRPKKTRNKTRKQTLTRKQPVLTCRLCNKVGRSWGWMRLHFSLEHPTEDLAQVYTDKRIHLCDVCGMSFSSVYTLRAHQNIHIDSRPFACDFCSARFHRALSLSNHRKLHGPPNKPCGICGKKFRSTSNLHNHMRFHIGDRRYKCKICDKGFLHRSTLNEHVRGVHNNIRRVRKRVAGAKEKGH